MSALHQILAASRDRESHLDAKITSEAAEARKPALYAGVSTTTSSTDPSVSDETSTHEVQRHAPDVCRSLGAHYAELFAWEDQIGTANRAAHADVVLDGAIVLPNVSTAALMYMLKKLKEIRGILQDMPILDESCTWTKASIGWQAPTTRKTLMAKRKAALPLASATPEHPAQVSVIDVEYVAGTVATTKTSGAFTAAERRDRVERCARMIEAVSSALARANETATEPRRDMSGVLRGILL